jgi:hypothetical protein
MIVPIDERAPTKRSLKISMDIMMEYAGARTAAVLRRNAELRYRSTATHQSSVE